MNMLRAPLSRPFVNMCTNGWFFVLFLSINLSNKGHTPMCVDFSLRWQTETLQVGDFWRFISLDD